jgi:uncharacterized protein (TIGR03437 family)
MIRPLFLTLAFATNAFAQFFGLATPADGSRVYFATTLRQKNTAQPTWGKLFQVGASGLSLVLARDQQVPVVADPTQGYPTNAYDFAAADVSSNGQMLAAAAWRSCLGSQAACNRVGPAVTTIYSGGAPQDFPGILHLSPGGTWAFGSNGQPVDLLSPIDGYLVNVTTGELRTFGSANSHGIYQDIYVATSGRPVADDGTVVYSNGSSVMVLHDTDVRTIISPSGGDFLADAIIDAAGRVIVYSVCRDTTPGGPNNFYCTAGSLRLADPAGSGSSLLAADGYAPSMSDDGAQVLYLSNRTGKAQVRIMRTAGGSDRQLTDDPDGVVRAILSGDGSMAYTVSNGGRLSKIFVATAAAQEVVPRTPFLARYQEFTLAPGKLVPLTGAGLSDSNFVSAPPLPLSLGGVEVTIQGRPARILSVNPTTIMVLVPPDAMPGQDSLDLSPIQLETTSPSPFDGLVRSANISSYSPQFLTVNPTIPHSPVLAAHQDWSALISSDNPAHPGEVVHAYAVGLGPTTPSVPYGDAAPIAEPLARLSNPIDCTTFPPGNIPIEFFFQGLAPGMAGVYQVDFRIPAQAADGDLQLQCGLGGSFPVRRPSIALP